MSQGTLYAPESTRTAVAIGLVKVFGLDVKILGGRYSPDNTQFPLRKYPGFVTEKGVVLFEVTAIVYYLIKLSKEAAPLLGGTDLETAEILKWVSFANTEFMSAVCDAFWPYAGRAPYNKRVVDAANAKIDLCFSIMEARLSDHTYLVGRTLTLADLILASFFWRPLQTIWDKAFVAEHPVVFKWWKTVTASPILSWKFPADYEFLQERKSLPEADTKMDT